MKASRIPALALGLCAITHLSGCGDSTGPATVDSVEVSLGIDTIMIGQTVQLTATVRDLHGNALGVSVRWSSSDTLVATVSATGLVTGVAAGTAVITATAGRESDSATVTVLAPVETVEVHPAYAVITKGRTRWLNATPRDKDGNLLDRPVEWSSDNTAVATVDTSGLVAGVDTGTAVITATCEGKSGTSNVVVAVPVSGSWSGSGTDQGVTVLIDVTLQEAANGYLSGSGTIGVPGQVLDDFTVTTGLRRYEDVDFTMVVPGYEPFIFSGTYYPNDAMGGVINESGFENFPMTFTRTAWPGPKPFDSATARMRVGATTSSDADFFERLLIKQ
jgi:hypothetical protein